MYKHWSGTSGAGLRPENGVMGLKEVLKAREGSVLVNGNEVDLWKESERLYTGLNKLISDTKSTASISIVTLLPTQTTNATFLPTLLFNLVPAHDETEKRYHLVTLTDESHVAHAFRDEDNAQLVFTTLQDVQTILDAATAVKGTIIVPSSSGITPEVEKRVSARGWRLMTLDEAMSTDAYTEKVESGKASDPTAVHSVHYVTGADGVPERRTVTNQVRSFFVDLRRAQQLIVDLSDYHRIPCFAACAFPGLSEADREAYHRHECGSRAACWFGDCRACDLQRFVSTFLANLNMPRLTLVQRSERRQVG